MTTKTTSTFKDLFADIQRIVKETEKERYGNLSDLTVAQDVLITSNSLDDELFIQEPIEADLYNAMIDSVIEHTMAQVEMTFADVAPESDKAYEAFGIDYKMSKEDWVRFIELAPVTAQRLETLKK